MFKKSNRLLNISELAIMIGLVNTKNNKPLTHTLRFWETKFKQLKPTILAGGRRYYSNKDIEVVKMIFFLLKEQGMTVNGAKKMMNDNLKDLDDTKSTSIKALYYKKLIKEKSKSILKKIKKLNGKKNTY
jgi:DNA-binding transcriptional MerR regulator|tara:strand:+ start:110 stop:499 length:390 start_codon:yes stop_codon:yes gene_type:complete